MEYGIEIATYNSSGIRAIGAEFGATHMRLVDATGEADDRVALLAIPTREGGEFLVLDTNADPIAEGEEGWVEALEEAGIIPPHY